MTDEQRKAAELLGIPQGEAEKIVNGIHGAAGNDGQRPAKPAWKKQGDFDFGNDLRELMNAVAKCNGLFVKLTPVEWQRCQDWGIDEKIANQTIGEAMDCNSKCIAHLSEYVEALVRHEMFEKYVGEE